MKARKVKYFAVKSPTILGVNNTIALLDSLGIAWYLDFDGEVTIPGKTPEDLDINIPKGATAGEVLALLGF